MSLVVVQGSTVSVRRTPIHNDVPDDIVNFYYFNDGAIRGFLVKKTSIALLLRGLVFPMTFINPYHGYPGDATVDQVTLR